MSAKYYCDICGEEITEQNNCVGATINNVNNRLGAVITRKDKTLKVEIITALNDKWNDGDVCRHCVLDALSKLDNRPKLLPA